MIRRHAGHRLQSRSDPGNVMREQVDTYVDQAVHVIESGLKNDHACLRCSDTEFDVPGMGLADHRQCDVR